MILEIKFYAVKSNFRTKNNMKLSGIINKVKNKNCKLQTEKVRFQ